MADFALPNAPEYEAWRQETARQLQRRYLRALAELVAQETAVAHYPAAKQYAQRYLVEDELDETMHARQRKSGSKRRDASKSVFSPACAGLTPHCPPIVNS
jgi:DNA-binding SARP family transcriptional activator